MKKLFFLFLFVLSLISCRTVTAQLVWSENFNAAPCSTGCRAGGYTSPNGTWTETVTGTQGTHPNAWFISCAENAMPIASCGSGCNSGSPANSLHIANQPNSPGAPLCPTGDCGASYDLGLGSPGQVATSIRAESPTINLTGKSNLNLSFNYLEGGDETTDNFAVWYYNGATWVFLADPAKTTNSCGGSHKGKWTNFFYKIPASQNNNANFKIGFRWVNNADGIGTNPSVAIANIEICQPQTFADLTVPTQSVCKGECLSFTDNSSSTCSTIAIWSWTFQGGTPASFIGQNPPPVCYAIPGEYDVTLFVQDNAGASNTLLVTDFVTVSPCDPLEARIFINQFENCKDSCIQFTDASTSRLGTISSWTWTFEGGMISGSTQNTYSGQTPPKICYTDTGEFHARLVVSDEFGSDTANKYIKVIECIPLVPNFSADKTTICKNECVTFTDSSEGNIFAEFWTFQGGLVDGSTDSIYFGQSPPQVCYPNPGSFDVTVEIADGLTPIKTLTKTGYILVDVCTEIKLVSDPGSITIFPNPFSNSFSVISENNFSKGKIFMYDILGREVKQLNLPGEGTLIVTDAELTHGVYFLRIVYENGNSISKRLIKQ